MARLNHVKSFRGTSKTEDGNLTCGSCGGKIGKGDSYLWWANRMGRYSAKRVRCSKPECRPKPWEYQTTSPHIAGLMQAEDSGQTAIGQVNLEPVGPDNKPIPLEAQAETFADDIAAAVQAVADDVRGVGEGYRESATNIEDGFGHPTYQSEELEQKADGLDSQADELESWEAQEPMPERDSYEGEGADEEYGADVETWTDTVRDEASEAITTGCEVPY